MNSPSVRQLEEEYRAKVVELESKMAIAHMQVPFPSQTASA